MAAKYKILYIVSTLRNSGPTNQLLGIIKGLDKSKFDFQVLTLSPEPTNSRKMDFIKNNIKVDTLGLSRFSFLLFGKKELKKYIYDYKPDLIHTSGLRADYAVAKLNLKGKHVITIRNYVYDDFVAKYGKVIGNLASKIAIKSIHNCQNVVCCSETLKDMYEQKINKELYFIQNGVDIEKYCPIFDKNEIKKLRLKLQLPNDKIIFIMVGSLIKRKDPLTVIESFKLAKLDEYAQLVILGDGELLEECKEKADNNVVFRGNVNNVSDYLKASDVYISASLSEGLPNSVLEAASTGLNLILSEIPQHTEIFKGNKKYYESFKTKDIDELSSLLENVRKKDLTLNTKTVEYIRENFSNLSMSKKYQKLYQDILSKV